MQRTTTFRPTRSSTRGRCTLATTSSMGHNWQSHGYHLVLGSSSRWRAGILKRHGYTFSQLSPDIDEKAIRNDDPQVLTTEIATAKLEALKSRVDQAIPTIVICSDQVVTFAGKIREKPESVEEARSFIKSYRNAGCSTVTAVLVYNTKTQRQAGAVDIATVHFGDIPDTVMEDVLAKGDVMHCAGGFTVDDPLVVPYVAKVEGTTESIEGLPVHVMEWLIERTL